MLESYSQPLCDITKGCGHLFQIGSSSHLKLPFSHKKFGQVERKDFFKKCLLRKAVNRGLRRLFSGIYCIWCHTEPFQNSCYGPANRQPTTSTSCDSDSHDFSHVASALALVDLFHPVLFLSFGFFFLSLRTISLVSVSTPLRGCLNGGVMAQWVEITHASTTITHQVLLPVCP